MLLKRICSIENCGRERHARELCITHYARWKRGVSLEPEVRSRVTVKADECSEEGCSNEVRSKGLCGMHYVRLLRYGHTRYRDRKKTPKICSMPACDNWLYAKGLCSNHYLKSRTWATFGLTVDDYLEILEKQGGVCRVCEQPETSRDGKSQKVRELALDHCHTSGKMRGLLCQACNTALGLFKDDPTILNRAVAYLTTSRLPTTTP